MLEWILPITAFPILTALYLGGAGLRIEGGGGVQQLLGLAMLGVLFFATFFVVHLVLGGIIPGILASGLGTLAAAALLRPLARVCFRIVGVTLTPDASASPLLPH